MEISFQFLDSLEPLTWTSCLRLPAGSLHSAHGWRGSNRLQIDATRISRVSRENPMHGVPASRISLKTGS